MDLPEPPPLSPATARNSGWPSISNVPNHPTVHPASFHHSDTVPDLSKLPHRPEAHLRLPIQVSDMDTQTPTQIMSAAKAPSSDKGKDLPRDKGPMPDKEFEARGERDWLTFAKLLSSWVCESIAQTPQNNRAMSRWLDASVLFVGANILGKSNNIQNISLLQGFHFWKRGFGPAKWDG